MMTQEERVHSVASYGFTERQAGFLATVLLHAGVCVGRQYCAYARIVRGKKVHEFFGGLVSRRFATRYICGHNKAQIYHLHHRGLYRAVGEPHARLRKSASLARATERLMILDHVLAEREVTWLASESEKVAHFLVNRIAQQRELPQLTFGEAGAQTIRYFPDRLPIGCARDGRYIFVYLVTGPWPTDFRAFLRRHFALLRATNRWTVRLLLPRHLSNSRRRFEVAAREELASPIRPAVADELLWYFHHTQTSGIFDVQRYRRARKAFDTAHFRAIHRAWLKEGDCVVEDLSSTVLAEAMERGDGVIQSQFLAHQYLHFARLVGTA